jgi:uncharacterized membrane protein
LNKLRQSGGGATMSIMADHTPMNLIAIKSKAGRIESIDLLRGIVMIIMALDHARDYFHYDAFMYNPTDLLKTNVPLFFTRWITHYCAPVFVFLAGISAYLYGVKKTRKDLSFFLLTRGVWLILAEFFILSFFRTFNPSYTYINLQVIWVIGLSMIFLSGMVYINNRIILIIAILFITTHNLLDAVHVQGNGLIAILWSIMHDVKRFTFGDFTFFIHYPLLPWLGIMALGYYYGSLYVAVYDTVKRKRILFLSGVGFVSLFIFLRFPNLYGDAAEWSLQKGSVYSFLSILNVSKYPPSLLYTLITLGPAMIFLAYAEKPLKAITGRIAVFGRVPMFYYLAHILLIHILAVIAALITGHPDMIILSNGVNDTPALKGYGFNLFMVYMVWTGLVLLLYPFCKWFDHYKRTHVVTQWWLSYF